MEGLDFCCKIADVLYIDGVYGDYQWCKHQLFR